MEQDLFDIAIVGFGPTGATLANLLAQHGHRILVIDRESQMYHLPRAVHFDDEVMRVFQTVGIAQALEKAVLVNPGMRFLDENNNTLLDWPRPQTRSAHGWNASYRLHQPDLEALLRDKLSQFGNVTTVTCCKVESLQETQEHIKLECVDTRSGAAKSFRAQYVVGCDGANSTVRHHIGDGLEDLGFHERWLVVDLLLKKPRPDLGDHSIQFCDPERPMTYCRVPGIRRRWEITVLEDETDAQMLDDARVWQFLSRWITPEDAELERKAVYTFRSAIARRWRRDRLMIAGDAAHLTPPFMGQGMCTGIRDASNLAWKLNEVLSGQSDQLLESYQAERSPHARAYIETAMQLGKLINSVDPDGALTLAQQNATEDKSMRSIRPQLGASSIVLHDDGVEDSPVGRPFGQPQLNIEPNWFDDCVGYNHAILSAQAPDTPLPKGFTYLNPGLHPQLAQALAKTGGKALWVRPDRYIGALASTVEELLAHINKNQPITKQQERN